MKTLTQKWLLVLIAFISFSFTVEGQYVPSSSITRAKELWELAVAAKGGRGALYKIHAIAEIRDDKGKNVSLVVLPDKYFSWFDARPGQFGLDIKLYNFETGFGYRNSGISGTKLYNDIRIHSDFSLVKGRLTELMYSQLFLLLETRWMQPKPILALKDSISGKSVDRVDVLIEGYGSPKRFAIYLDEESHLPVRIAMCRDINSQEISDFCCFSNKRSYVEIAGVKIPIESSGKNTPWRKDHIELNPNYDPRFFDRLPDINAGGLQWRKTGEKATIPSSLTFQAGPLTQAQKTQLIRSLESSDKEVRQEALQDIITAGKQIIPDLMESLAASPISPAKRYGVAVALSKLGEPRIAVMEALADLVTDVRLEEQERQDAAFGLLGNDQGIAALADLLLHPDPIVRRYAIFAFDELTERREIPKQIENVIPTIRKLTQDRDEAVQKTAKEVLEQISIRFKRK
ncbi:MAG TPA: hypothetical protein PLD20_21710 [Blastocatellia bacterium]|nr:hypothetical protein [Blastocatellia bacterium]HMZ20569.1 hypothetical protein [Blastocatellia bacterium]